MSRTNLEDWAEKAANELCTLRYQVGQQREALEAAREALVGIEWQAGSSANKSVLDSIQHRAADALAKIDAVLGKEGEGD